MRAQLAFEYIVITVLGLLILMGGYYVVISLMQQSQSNINVDEANSIANRILDESFRIYELGIPSATKITVDMPDDVTEFFVHNYDNSYLVFVIGEGRDQIELDFVSDVPLHMSLPCSNAPNRCNQGVCSCLPPAAHTRGEKTLSLHTVACDEPSGCVTISYNPSET